MSQHEARAYARASSFSVGSQASLRDRDEHPSAIEMLLGALGADLMHGVAEQARRAGLLVDALEISLTGCLNNPLVQLGVVGEEGHAGLDHIAGTLYVSMDGEEDDVRRIWSVVLARSPLYQTLVRAAHVSIELRMT
jgi:hypothetical protein